MLRESRREKEIEIVLATHAQHELRFKKEQLVLL